MPAARRAPARLAQVTRELDAAARSADLAALAARLEERRGLLESAGALEPGLAEAIRASDQVVCARLVEQRDGLRAELARIREARAALVRARRRQEPCIVSRRV